MIDMSDNANKMGIFCRFYWEAKDGTNAEITKTKGVGQDGSTINNVSLSDRKYADIRCYKRTI